MVYQYILRVICLFQIVKDIFLSIFSQFDITAPRKVGKAIFDLLAQRFTSFSYHELELHGKVVLLVCLSKEIQYGQTVFAGT